MPQRSSTSPASFSRSCGHRPARPGCPGTWSGPPTRPRPTAATGAGLAELVKRSWDAVAGAVEEALAADGDAPVVVTEAAPLARYDNMGLLARWTDLGTSRNRAVWLVVPQIGGASGASLDGRPVPLAAPSQYVALDTTWIDDLATTVAAAGPVASGA